MAEIGAIQNRDGIDEAGQRQRLKDADQLQGQFPIAGFDLPGAIQDLQGIREPALSHQIVAIGTQGRKRSRSRIYGLAIGFIRQGCKSGAIQYDRVSVERIMVVSHGVPSGDEAFERLANLATKAGVEGRGISIHAPLIDLGKADIVREGMRLGVDFAATVSCYQADADGRACGACDACRLRTQGFAAAKVADPTRYAE